MKRNIFFATALALCMGMSFTSCLDSDNDTDTQGLSGFVKVTSSYMGLGSFKSYDGKTTINPTTTSMNNLDQNGFKMSEVNAAFIQGTYSKDENLDAETSKTLNNVNVIAAVPLDASVEIINQAGVENDSVNMACIRSIGKNETIYSVYPETMCKKPWFYYDETTLILPISYGMSGQKLHAFTLVYNTSESKQGETTLKLSLRHYNANDSSSEKDSYTFSIGQYGYLLPHVYFFAFDLRNAIYMWQGITGSSDGPKTITIEYVASEYNTNIEQGETKTMTIERKALGQE